MGHRYSLDGGASWVTPLAPVSVPHGQYGMFLLADDAVLFPEPSASALLLGSGLAALASRRAFRTGAGARPRRGGWRRPV
jgi:hypothetical protein